MAPRDIDQKIKMQTETENDVREIARKLRIPFGESRRVPKQQPRRNHLLNARAART